MKSFHLALCVIFWTMFSSGCATPAVSSPHLQARLAPGWIASAERVRSGDRTVYYRGQASGAIDSGNWAGTVRGDILVLDPAMAIVIPAGAVSLTSKGDLEIKGPHHLVTSDTPAWRHLLRL
jgi:hypothetical protein